MEVSIVSFQFQYYCFSIVVALPFASKYMREENNLFPPAKQLVLPTKIT